MSDRKVSGLSTEYKKFNKIIKHLRKLHKDTFLAIDNVISSENLSEGNILKIDLYLFNIRSKYISCIHSIDYKI